MYEIIKIYRILIGIFIQNVLIFTPLLRNLNGIRKKSSVCGFNFRKLVDLFLGK